MDPQPQKKHQRIIKKLTNKYRLVIMNDETFEEKLSMSLTRINVMVFISVLAMAFAFIIYALFIFTPLKEYIPGYGDVNVRRDLIDMKSRADSLEIALDQQAQWVNNIKDLLEGNLDSVSIANSVKEEFFDTIKLDRIPIEDILLREEIEREEGYALLFYEEKQPKSNDLFSLNFLPPVKGYITSEFNPEKEHFGIDIVAQDNTPILATLDGTVIFSGWTLETGYVVVIQHGFNILSFYKHNSVVLKKTGNFVKAGEPVAIIGNTGELTTGPHLHFELWKDGLPVNPEDFLIF